MNFIDELLKDEKVEWKKLGEVCEIVRGIRVKKNELISGGKYPVVSGGTGYMGYLNEYNRNEETITVAQYGTAGYVNWQKRKFWANDVCFCVYPKNIILNKYLYYFLSSKQNYLYKVSNKSAIPYSISKENILKIKISIPSLETQEKIVKILDNFTKYVTELQARNKQYNYYRDMLLSEDYLNKISEKLESQIKYEISCIELEKIIKIKNGKDWKSLGKGNIPVYGSGGKMGVFVDKYSYNKPTVLIPRKGSIENIFYLEEPFWNVDTIFYTEINEEKILPKYYYYFMQNYNIKSLSTDSTRPSITQSTLNKLKILLPPIEIQDKIVKILDRFQELLSDTKGLLPLEIEQRRKQYEYYREKLLTFDKEEGYALSTAQHSTAQHSTAQHSTATNNE